MRVIGVVDLRGGLAVHARGGVRGQYAPVDMIAGSRIDRGDPLALARAYIVRFGLKELYIADLDAILTRPPQDTVIAALAALGTPLWVDAGVYSVDRARRLLGWEPKIDRHEGLRRTLAYFQERVRMQQSA